MREIPGIRFSRLLTLLALLLASPALAYSPPPNCVTSGYGLNYSTSTNAFGCVNFSGSGGVTWPTSGDIVISAGTSNPTGLAPVNGQVAIGSGGIWTTAAITGTGTVTSVIAGTGLTGGTITTTGTIALGTTTVTAASYGSATASPTFTVNAEGQLTAAANVTITPAVGSITGLGTNVAAALGNTLNAASGLVGYSGALGTPASGVGTNLTGTASGLTAGTVTTNANLTGVITSIGNTTSTGAQTGTGNTFVMSVGPTITSSFTATGLVTLADLVNIGSNTVIANATASSASPTALAVPSCSGASNALTWTLGTGFGCNTISGSGSPGGSTTQVQYNLSGSFAGASNLTIGTSVINIPQGTVTTAIPALNVTGTWNNSGVTFDGGIVENITNTASNSASNLIDLKVGGTSQFSVSESGAVSIGALSNAFSLNAGVLTLPSQFYLGGTVIGADNPSGSSMLKLVGASETIYFGALNQSGYNNILVLGDGLSSSGPVTQGLSGQSAANYGTTNLTGGNLLIMAGMGSGTATSGSINFQTAVAGGTSGNTQNPVGTVMTINSSGSLILSNASTHAGQATCWTTSGQIGYCTSVVSVTGSCTCTGL